MTGRSDTNQINTYTTTKVTSYEGISEVQLWQEFKKGDKNALSQLFRLYYKPLTAYGLNMYADYDFIKDCIQELFLELWLYRQRLNNVDSVKYYIITCFRRRVIRNLETIKKNKHYDLSENYKYIITNSFEADIITEQADKEKKYYLTRELGNLTKRQREAIHLKFYQGQSYEKIAVIMSLNYQSVKNLIHNGIKSLREKLQYDEFLA